MVEPGGALPALPLCASKADIDRLHGQRVRIEARYDVDPVVRGKALQLAYLELPDGTQIARAYRPVTEELGLLEKRVVAIGKVYRDSGQGEHVQALGGPHFYPERIERAMGEPLDPAPPMKRPPPPAARTEAELRARKGLWVNVTGTLASVTPRPDGDTWGDAELGLAGGPRLRIPFVHLASWKPRVGAEVTVIGRVPRDGGAELEGVALCPTADLVRCQKADD
jgi:hypothetical protein